MSTPPRDVVPIAPALLRSLLRKLRDANLHVPHIAIGGTRSVSVVGCLSLDAPVDLALRYRVRWPDGVEEVLVIESADGMLGVALCDLAGNRAGPGSRVALHADEAGRITAPDWKARVDPQAADTRQMAHFLRRLVRGLFAARAA